MKKTVFALSALALASLSAQAQSSVNAFGLLDVGYTYTTASGNGKQLLLNTDGNTSSRLGFRGREALGNGLSAGFWLESAISPDTGLAGGTSTNNINSLASGTFAFGRRSTLELAGPFGEVRLGRDYVPTFTNLTASYHPFGTNGLGNSGQLFYPVNAGGTTVRTHVRASNALNYFTPNMGGFQANLMYALGEELSNAAAPNNGKYAGGRVQFGSGPFNIAAATGRTYYSTGNYDQSNIAANYQFGPAKLMYLWGQNKVGVTKTTANMIGAQVKVGGSGEIRAAYTMLKASGVANDANQFAIGYVHNLSKRTALYGNASIVDNRGTGTRFVVGSGQAVLSPGGNSNGIEVGMRHAF